MKTNHLAFEAAAGRIGQAIEQAQIDFRLSDAEILRLLAFEIAYRSGLLDTSPVGCAAAGSVPLENIRHEVD
jgi:hypothetical protein